MAGQEQRFASLGRGGLVARQVGPNGTDPAAFCRLQAMRAAAFPILTAAPDDPAVQHDDPLDAHAVQILIEPAGGQDAPLASFRVLMLPDAADLGSSYAARFYDLAPLAALQGALVEPGRFCLAPGLAPGLAADVLRLAWASITALVDASGAGTLIGCSSFAGADPAAHLPALTLLASHHLGPEALRPGRRAGQGLELLPLARPGLEPAARRAGLAGLPPLLRSYLAMGAWVSDHAVIDPALNTLHVLTVLATSAVPAARASSLRQVAQAATHPERAGQ